MISKIGSSLLIRTGVVFVAILAVTGFATGVIPVRCLVGKACAPQAAVTAPVAVADSAPSSEVKSAALSASDIALPGPSAATASSAAAVDLVADVVPDKPTITKNDVIASTFALLPADLQKPALDGGSARPKSLTAASNVPANSDLKTRKVKTLTVRADGTPLIPQELVAQAYAEAKPATQPDSPAIVAATRISAGEEPVASSEPVASAEPADKPAAKPAASKPASTTTKVASAGKSGKISGSGSNVRSAPVKGSKVLFVLPPGTTVTVGENSNGWIKVTDAKGRSGWVYKDFVH